MKIELRHNSEKKGEVFEVICESGRPEKVSRFPESVLSKLNNKLNFFNLCMKHYDEEGFPIRNSKEEIFTALFWKKKPLFDGQLFKVDEINAEGIEFNEGTYYGQDENGVPEGFGFLVYGEYQIESRFSRGKPVGKGRILGYKEVAGIKISGGIIDGKLNGKAEITFRNGERYEGDTLNNQMKGKGKYFYSDGSVYDGEFSHNLKHGKGVYNCHSNTQYSGYWENDTFIG